MSHKILVIDDQKVVVEVVKDALERSHYEVITAFDGKEGFQKAQNEGPDLIVLDIRMPLMDGYEFMRALRMQRAAEGRAMTPVIVLTGSDAMEDLFRLEGVKGYFVKPPQIEELVQRIKECLADND